MESITETRTYWKVGTGNIYTGGSIGHDSESTKDGQVVGATRTRPDGAQNITEAEFLALTEAVFASMEQVVEDGQIWLTQQRADEEALLISARGKLTTGTPLSAEEAALLTRSL